MRNVAADAVATALDVLVLVGIVRRRLIKLLLLMATAVMVMMLAVVAAVVMIAVAVAAVCTLRVKTIANESKIINKSKRNRCKMQQARKQTALKSLTTNGGERTGGTFVESSAGQKKIGKGK